MGPKFKKVIVRLVKNQYFIIATCFVPKESKFSVDKYFLKKTVPKNLYLLEILD